MTDKGTVRKFFESSQGQKVILWGTVAVGGYLLYRYLKSNLGKKLDISSPENAINSAVESVGAKITGNPNWTVTDQLLNTFPWLKSSAEKQFEASQKPMGEREVNGEIIE